MHKYLVRSQMLAFNNQLLRSFKIAKTHVRLHFFSVCSMTFAFKSWCKSNVRFQLIRLYNYGYRGLLQGERTEAFLSYLFLKPFQ